MSDPISFQDVTPRHGLPLLFAGQAQKEAFVNEALLRADFAIACVVEGERDSPPPDPLPGQAWLVGATPSDAFAGHAGAIAGWSAAGWRFIEASEGRAVYDRSAGCRRLFRTGWQLPASPSPPSGGATVDAEARAAIVNLLETLVDAGLFATS